MYEKFIEKYKTQYIPKGVCTEKHHIIPRYMKGTNEPSNLIVLTYRQHILAHLLLYRKYKNIEDITAYRMMRSFPEERKSIICKMIGERHKQTGHIYLLGKKNAETGWINLIKTPESLRKGGINAGKIAKETGQILTIRTEETSRKGGITQGNIAKNSGQIQSLAKYKGKYVLIDPEGNEYQHAFQMERILGINRSTLTKRCRSGSFGYSRRLKTEEELSHSYLDIELSYGTFVENKDTKPTVHTKQSKYIFIDSEQEEFTDINALAKKHNISKNQARSRCVRGNCGFSIKHK